MKKALLPLTLVALLAVAAPASAGKAVSYKGKTSSGHPITFKVKGKRMYDLTAGVRTACVPIQGPNGFPKAGVDLFGYSGSRRIKSKDKWTFMAKPSFHFREVTTNYGLQLKRRGPKLFTGRMRLQYSYLVSTYPVGTFNVYSCLGGGTFKARAR